MIKKSSLKSSQLANKLQTPLLKVAACLTLVGVLNLPHIFNFPHGQLYKNGPTRTLDPLPLLDVPNGLRLPKDVEVLCCIPVKGGSIAGLEHYLKTGEGHERYSLGDVSNWKLNIPITLLAVESKKGSTGGLFLILLQGRQVEVNEVVASQTQKNLTVRCFHFNPPFIWENATDFIRYSRILRPGELSKLPDFHLYLRGKLNDSDYESEFWGLADAMIKYQLHKGSNEFNAEHNIFSPLIAQPPSKRGQIFPEIIQGAIASYLSVVDNSENSEKAVDPSALDTLALAMFQYALLLSEQKSAGHQVKDFEKYVEECLSAENVDPATNRVLKRLKELFNRYKER